MPSYRNNRTGAGNRVRGERRYVVDGHLLILPEEPVAPEVIQPDDTQPPTPQIQPTEDRAVREGEPSGQEENLPRWVEPAEGTHELPCWVDTPLPEAKGIEPIIEVKDLNPLPKNPKSPKK